MAGIYNRGATPVKRTAGAKQFQGRDPSKVWSDGGTLDDRLVQLQTQLTSALEEFRKSLKGYAGQNALEAVTEYVSAGEFSIVMVGDDPHVAFRVYDGEDTGAGVMSYASLTDLMAAAKDEAEEERDEELLAALRRVGSMIGPQIRMPDLTQGVPMPERTMSRGRGRIQARQ